MSEDDYRTKYLRLRQEVLKNEHEITQTLGRALGYPLFADDQKNFPGATEEKDGVCVGEHVAVTLAEEAAERIKELEMKIEELLMDLAGVDT